MKKQIIATSIILASITTVIATEAQANADSINGVDVTTDQTQKKPPVKMVKLGLMIIMYGITKLQGITVSLHHRILPVSKNLSSL